MFLDEKIGEYLSDWMRGGRSGGGLEGISSDLTAAELASGVISFAAQISECS